MDIQVHHYGTGSLSASIDSTGQNGPTADQLPKFSVCFQGGFDGIAPYKLNLQEMKVHYIVIIQQVLIYMDLI